MTRTIAEIQSTVLFAIAPDEPIGTALDRIMAFGITAVPVVDANRRPVGIVSVVQLLGCRPETKVEDRMTRPAVVARGDEPIETAARRAAQSGVPRLVVVDAEGCATGVVTALDLVGALLDIPTGAECFPHRDEATGVSWTETRPLELTSVGLAPNGPGLVALYRGGGEVHETLVWSEATSNVRKRLYDMLSHPERETPQLARLLASCADVTFRAAPVLDPTIRRAALDRLRSQVLRVVRPAF